MDSKTIEVSANELADAIKTFYTNNPLASTELFMKVEAKLRQLQAENELYKDTIVECSFECEVRGVKREALEFRNKALETEIDALKSNSESMSQTNVAMGKKLLELQAENEASNAPAEPESLAFEIVRPSDNMTEIKRANLDSLFIAFGDSVIDVVVEYRGSGDCGGIEEVNINGVLDLAVKVNLIRQYHDHDEVVTLGVEDAIRSVADDLIDRRHGGFENNEGGGGEITFDVANKTVQIDHYDYIVEEQYDHETLML